MRCCARCFSCTSDSLENRDAAHLDVVESFDSKGLLRASQIDMDKPVEQ